MCTELCGNLELERADQHNSNRSSFRTSKRLINKALFASAVFAGFAAVVGVNPATAEEGDFGFDDSGLDGIDGDSDADGDSDSDGDSDGDSNDGDDGFGSYDFDGYGIDGLDDVGQPADTGSAGLDNDTTEKADDEDSKNSTWDGLFGVKVDSLPFFSGPRIGQPDDTTDKPEDLTVEQTPAASDDQPIVDLSNLPPGTVEISYEEMQALMERDLGPQRSTVQTDDVTPAPEVTLDVQTVEALSEDQGLMAAMRDQARQESPMDTSDEGETDQTAQIRADIQALGLEGIVTIGTEPTNTEGAQRVDLSDLNVTREEPEVETPVDTSDLPSNDPARTVTWTEQFFSEDPYAGTYDINEEAARAQPGDDEQQEQRNTVVDRNGNNVVDRNGNPVFSGADTSDNGGNDSAPSERPAVSAGPCVDSDGDGWGWDGQNSCRTQSNRPDHPRCVNGQASDSDGDGWGWENHKSCLV